MSSQAVTPRRLTALILPVCLAGLGVLVAAGLRLRDHGAQRSRADRPRGTHRGRNTRGALSRADQRGDRRRCALADVRLRGCRDRSLRVGRRRSSAARGHGRRSACPAPAVAAHLLQRGRARPRRSRRRCIDRAHPRRECRCRGRAGRTCSHRRQRRQHRPDLGGDRAQQRPAVSPADADARARDHRAVCVHGVCCADARRAVGARAGPIGRARRAVARDRAVPALDASRAEGDATGAHGSADRARQSPSLPRAAPA